MKKEYGKLSTDQFRRLVGHLPEIRRGSEELPAILRAASSEKLKAVLEDGVLWAGFYELPFSTHVALALYVLGIKDEIVAMAQAQDPQEELLRLMDRSEELAERATQFDTEKLSACLAAVIALQRTVLSIMLYQQSMSALIEEVREGNDDALFRAVRVDRAVMCCPSVAFRVSRAELLGDKRFFQRLRNAIRGPSRKHWEAYMDLRYSLAILRELGLDSLSDAELEHLLVDVLRVYPKTFTARKNLRKHFYESRKIKRR